MKLRGTGTLAVVAVVTASLTWSSPASAWGSEGHQYVGNLAWMLLNPNARAHVRELLGPNVSLGQAAVWPDCVRSVNGSPTTGYHYHKDQFTPKVCDAFGSSASEVQRMTDYAARNWTNCPYAGHQTKCNLSYHFADVNVNQHTDYAPTYFGAEPYDVVHLIEAATVRLKCKQGQPCSVPVPFSIADKREALLLLAHMVGDVHQPLHVGAIYLDSNNAETGDSGTSTIGGNALLIAAGNKGNNLHHSWDDVPDSFGAQPSASAIKSACQIAPLPNPTAEPPAKWATESVVAARSAYNGMSFTKDTVLQERWDIQFQNKQQYASMRRTVQAQRVIAGGAHLAALLNSIWPSSKKATACNSA